METPAPPVSVAVYLFARLRQLGVEHVFGVPGDFNLLLLEELDELDAPRWVGTANELGASYAADGYSRERGFGALVTTYGVGELSAINGVAGSFAEQVPVLHIVGAPRTTATARGLPLHHTMLDGDAGHFQRAAAEVTTAQVVLGPDTEPGELIDQLLQTILDTSLPGYLSIPEDIVGQWISGERLATTLTPTASSPSAVAEFRRRVAPMLEPAERVVLLAGAGVNRARCERQLRRLAESAALPVATLLDAKGALDERHPLSVGVYQGAVSADDVRAVVEGADVLVRVGARPCDTLTGGFSHRLDDSALIELDIDHAAIDGHPIHGIRLADALSVIETVIVERLSEPVTANAYRLLTAIAGTHAHDLDELDGAVTEPDAPLTQARLWQTVAAMLPTHSTVLADAGTSFYGIGAELLPDDSRFIGQPVWSSIGYCLPAALGAQLAQPDRRTVLLIGDGAAQMTIQELGTIAREHLKPIIILVDNNGYTIERAIRGTHSSYNDITRWNWPMLAAGLTAGSGQITVSQAATNGELFDALHEARTTPDQLVLIQAHLDRLDVPGALGSMIDALAQSAP
ncbi:MAG TPA: thiamine pyrophosphate-binding protein [Solirubrobacteraceae bacterium]|nr:thiamine pyrophosphate-binding protein [Solirubrobacteraceae bacterium]